MLPDGAWDNSWGTRNNKWSYWGSRTSDGCQPGYGLLAKKSPEFAEAVRRNTRLLKACTHDGLLHGGPMFNSAKGTTLCPPYLLSCKGPGGTPRSRMAERNHRDRNGVPAFGPEVRSYRISICPCAAHRQRAVAGHDIGLRCGVQRGGPCHGRCGDAAVA